MWPPAAPDSYTSVTSHSVMWLAHPYKKMVPNIGNHIDLILLAVSHFLILLSFMIFSLVTKLSLTTIQWVLFHVDLALRMICL